MGGPKEVGFDVFVAELLDGIGRKADPTITPLTRVDGYCEGDHLLKGLILSSVIRGAHAMPDRLVAAIETFGDAYEWSAARRVNETSPPVPIKLAAGELATRTARVRLRPVRPQDIPWLYELAASPDTGFRWQLRGVTPNPQTFGDSLYRGTLAQFVVERCDTGTICGLVDAYEANTAEGHAKISIISAERAPVPSSDGGPSTVFEGALLFISHLFRTFDLRKIYADIPGFNWHQFASGEDLIFQVEGYLRTHDYFDGRYWDRRIIAIYRDHWETFSAEWMPTFNDARRTT